jgi:peptidyl-tRNA hydrolase
VAFRPTTYPDLPKALAKLQVAGTDLPRRDSDRRSLRPGPVVVLNADLGMTTGKSAAQAGHAIFAWFLTLKEEDRAAWRAHGLPFRIELQSGENFARLEAQALADTVIVDAGRTEVEPDTTTAFVIQEA